MKDEPSRLPADIRASAERLRDLIKLNKQHLHDIRSAATADAAYAALSNALLNQLGLTSEVQTLMTWLKVGEMPQIAVVETRQEVKDWAETRLKPATSLTAAELRSLHRAGDHSLDPESELELALTIDRNVSVDGETRRGGAHG